MAKVSASESDNPLPMLAEIRYWHTRKLITDDQLVQAYQSILGEVNGSKLANGTEEEKKELLTQWLTASRPEPADQPFR